MNLVKWETTMELPISRDGIRLGNQNVTRVDNFHFTSFEEYKLQFDCHQRANLSVTDAPRHDMF